MLKSDKFQVIVIVSITYIFIFFILFVSFFWINVRQEKVLSKQNAFVPNNIKIIAKDSLILDMSNKYNGLRADIEKVEIANDKRFEVLGWSFGILCSFIIVILVMGIYNSNASIRDKVLEQLDRIDKDRNIRNENALIDFEKTKKLYQNELEELLKNKRIT